MQDIVLSLELAATYEEEKPYHNVVLLRTAANRIRVLEAVLIEIAKKYREEDVPADVAIFSISEIARRALDGLDAKQTI